MSHPTADLLLTGSSVWRGLGSSYAAPADAVAIKGDRIVAVGIEEDLRPWRGPHTTVIDVAGGLVLPGFQDAHIHAPFAGRNQLRVWLNDTVGRQGYLDQIAAYAQANPDERWILGGGWAMEYFAGGTPRKEDLDAIVPDRPVFLFNRDVHGAWVNSAALELGGISAATPDPGDGRIERDPATGEPTGTLHEGAAYTFNETVVPTPDLAEWRSAILQAQRHLHALGITGWQDAWVTRDTQAAYAALVDDRQLSARVVGALWWDRHRGLDQVGDLLDRRAGGMRPGIPGSGAFLPTTVKIMTDGVLENYTGALLEPYCDGCGGHTTNSGLSYVDRDVLIEAVSVLDEHGFQVHLHAIGDRAVRNALDAVEAARTRNGMNDLRHTIAHLQVVQPEDVARFAALGVVANCQTYWAQTEPQMDQLTIPYLGETRARLQYPFEAIRAAGARLAMGSDWAVTTANPLAQLEVAVNRVDPENRSTPPFLPEFAVSLPHALEAFTMGSAHVNHDDGPGGAGAIEIGRRADLVILDQDITAASFATKDGYLPIADAKVVTTVAAGTIVFQEGSA